MTRRSLTTRSLRETLKMWSCQEHRIKVFITSTRRTRGRHWSSQRSKVRSSRRSRRKLWSSILCWWDFRRMEGKPWNHMSLKRLKKIDWSNHSRKEVFWLPLIVVRISYQMISPTTIQDVPKFRPTHQLNPLDPRTAKSKYQPKSNKTKASHSTWKKIVLMCQS